MIKIFCDGGSRGNPGLAASAFVAYEWFGNTAENMRKIHEQGRFLGTATNNTAEYEAVILALDWLSQQRREDQINFNLDSKLVVSQINGDFKVKDSNLIKLFTQVSQKLANLRKLPNLSVVFNYVPREENFEADKLVNKTLDENS